MRAGGQVPGVRAVKPSCCQLTVGRLLSTAPSASPVLVQERCVDGINERMNGKVVHMCASE